MYDYDFIHDIVNTSPVVHVAFPPALGGNADPFPALLPMIGCMAKYSPDGDDEGDESRDLYLHGYVSSRIMRLSTTAVNGNGADEGLPLTVSATIVDGLVLSLTPNSHSYNYRSAVLHGYGEPVIDQDEKIWAMREITNKVLAERWENTRTPPTPTEMKTTNILKVRIQSASGKHRHGGPHDDKHDLKDDAMRSKVWTGVVPVWEQRGLPVQAGDGSVEKVPAYVTQALERTNRERKAKAEEGMNE